MAKSGQPRDKTRSAVPSSRKSGTESDSKLSKAIDRPIGAPDKAREEAPIGWDFGPDGHQPPIIPVPDEGAPADAAPPSGTDQSSARQGDENLPDGTGGAAPVASDAGSAAIAGVDDVAGEDGRISGSALHARGSGSLDAAAPVLRPVDPGGDSRPAPAPPAGGGGGGSSGDDRGQPEESYPGQQEDDTPGTVSPNAPPIVSGGHESEVTEDTILTSSGQLIATDEAPGSISWSVQGGTGAYGSLTIDADGRWTYTMDNDSPAVQGLKASDTVQEIYTVRVADSAGEVVDQQITITIKGTNDLPVISGTHTGEVTEDTALEAGGTLTTTDVDVGDTATWSMVGDSDGTYGALTLNPDGSWSYALDNDAAQGLKAGETVQEIFTVKATDSEGASVTQQVTVTVTGTNDVPVISGTATGTVAEDGTLAAQGALTAGDADVGDTATWSVVGDSDSTYGALTLNSDGSWSYALDNDAAQGLKAGETVQEIFTVKATDSEGASVTQQVTVTVTGTNDVPVISGTATGTVAEDGTLAAQGALTAGDADVGDTATWSVVGDSDSTYGALTLNSDGSWSYALDNDAAQGLKAGETVQEIFTVKAADSEGAAVTQQVTVTVTGTNDVPVISGTATGTVAEDGTLTAQGTLTTSDADVGDTATWSVVGDSDGTYGALTLNPDGFWSYALDNDAAQGLKAGETVQEIFTVKATDSAGAEVTQQVTVTVTGTNDVPVISGTATGAVVEDGTLTAQGTLTTSDADIGDTATWNVVGNDTGQYGELTLNSDGSWSYALDNDAAQGLKAGETVQEIFTVKATDSEGASVTQQVTVTVTGTNDVPVISGTATGTVAEDGTLTAQGALTTSDADIGDTATWSVVGNDADQYGELTLNADGSWSYALDNDAAQGLKAGETVQEIFAVKATDSAGAEVTQQITVTVTGTNDVPVISGTTTGAVAEDGTLTAQGALTTTDTDVGDTATWSVVGNDTGQYGELTLNTDGSWSYALDNDAAQGLKAGETVQEIFTVKAMDSAGASVTQQVTVTVTGTNDVPVISGTETGLVAEDGTLTAQGSLTSSDADIGDRATWSLVGDDTGQYGSLTLNPDGSWSYALDNDAANVQGLANGDTAQDIFTVQVTDSSGATVTQQVTITVTGTNDAPLISGTGTGTVEEDGDRTAKGVLTATDNEGGRLTWQLVGDGDSQYGSLSLDSRGNDAGWHYVLDNKAAQGLREGETVQEIFTVRVTDASGASTDHTVTVTIVGTNDVPVISGTTTGAVREDGTLTAQGTLTSSDADIGDTATWSLVSDETGHYGELTLNADGSWSYALDNDAAQGLKAGQSVQEIFTVKATDSAGAEVTQQVTVTVTGTNDVPVISGTTTGAVGEDGTLTAQGALTASDADVGDTATWSVVGDSDSTYGALTLNPDGSWSYALDNDAAQGLKAGETVQEIFTVKATDSAGAEVTQQVTITVTGTNDVPVISGATTGAVGEDGTLTAQGALTTTDADVGDTATWSVVGNDTGQYGDLTLNTDGSWSYALDNDAAQGLKAGETVQEIFTVKATDSEGASVTQQVTVTVTGTNDVPVISGSATSAVAEDGTLTAQGALTTTDADVGDTATWSVVGNDTGQYGELTLNADGSWSYALDNDAAQGLKAGKTAHEIFTVKATDSAGAEVTQQVTVTVTGTNDVPVISGTATSTVAEDGTLTAQGALTASDADVGDTVTWSVVNDGRGTYGDITVDQDGHWSYVLDNDSAQGLRDGQNAQEIFTVKVTDSSGATSEHQVTVTVAGTNDAPVISGSFTGEVTEDQDLTASGRLSVTDPDIGDTATWSIGDEGQGTYGHLTLDQDGHWSYVLDKDSAQGLHDGQNAQDVFTVKVTDSDGAVSEHQITMTVTGTNDAPVISGAFTGETQEDVTLVTSGDLVAKDVDVGDTVTWSVDGSATSDYGSLTVDPESGHWVYTLNNDAAQSLQPGQVVHDSFTVQATDQSGATTTQVVTVNVTGTADEPPPPVDAGGDITLVNVNDWYNPAWGGGYNATFELTLTDDMLQGGSLEAWILQVVVNNPNAVISGGWLNGFDGTVSFDPATGKFSNVGQGYQPELHAGDTIQFTIEVQGTGYNRDDISFSFQDADLAPTATAKFSAVVAATAPDIDTSSDAAASAANAAATAVALDHDASPSTDSTHATTAQTSDQAPSDHLADTTTAGTSDASGPATHPADQTVAATDGQEATAPASSDATGTAAAAQPAAEPPAPSDAQQPSAAPGEDIAHVEPTVAANAGDAPATDATHTDSGAAAVGGDQHDATASADTSSQADTVASSGASEPGQQPSAQDAAQQAALPSDALSSAPDSGRPAASGDAASAPAAHDSVSEVAPPVDAGGHITLVSVNDWYNPSWGGGYNATFQLTLTDDMLQGGSLEGWSLQIGVNNPNAAVSTGWLDGFNGTVSFDPTTGTFSNAGQDYQPELHAGDTIQFSIQVQNASFDRNDLSFSFQDLDPVPASTTASTGTGVAATAPDAGTSSDAADVQTAFVPAEVGAGEQVAHDSPHTGSAAGDAQPQPATVVTEEAAAHAGAAAAASDGQGADQSQTTADAQTGHASVADAGAADRDTSVTSVGDEHQAVAGSGAADVTTRAESDVGASADQGHGHEDMGLHLGQDPASHDDHGDGGLYLGQDHDDHGDRGLHLGEDPAAHDDHGDIGLHIGQDHDPLGGAAQAGVGPVTPDQAATTPSTAGAYLDFVESPSIDHASMAQAADQQSAAGAADYLHMVTGADQGAHEPPPPDHLFADAQIDHSHDSGAGLHDSHADAVHDDASLAAAATPPEPMPAEQDQGHGGH
ncbi:VCBS repeat-containing protein [Bradyrhizobium sp. AZCC 1678]|uniref:VCBS domain-containing protein n=1 Tax=Bradyrhizobium sp. AZCC 1678 TaxID=3117030 RepID=UPI002FF1700D